MFGKRKILVSGAGPVGLTAALALADKGQQVVVIDKEEGPGAHSYGLALHPDTLELLAGFGIIEAILDSAYRVEKIVVHDSTGHKTVMKLKETGHTFPFIAVMRQCDLEYMLLNSLEERQIPVWWNHRLATVESRKNSVRAKIQKLELQLHGYAAARLDWVVDKEINIDAPFIIGADGHLSLLRQLLGFEFRAFNVAQQFAVFEFTSETDLQNEMHIILLENSANALWPLPNGTLRWSFQIDDGMDVTESRIKDRHLVQLGSAGYPTLTDDILHDLLKKRASWFEGSVDEIKWQLAVRFESRMAEQFGKDRIWLAGDAGHMTGPVGIQSMNIGMLEAKKLADIMGDSAGKEYPENNLKAYNHGRIKEWQKLLAPEKHISVQTTADHWVEAVAPRLIPCIPASGNAMSSLLNKLGLVWN